MLIAAMLFSATVHAQLYCGSTISCNGTVGIGVQNTPVFGLTFGLRVDHNASSGGGLMVSNPSSSASAMGIFTGSANGYGLYSTSTSGSAVAGLSTSGKAINGETSTGYAVYGKATLSSGKAGYFDGKVKVADDLEVTDDVDVAGSVNSTNLTVTAPATHNFGVAHFKAGPSRQLFIAANLGPGGFNYLSQANDFGVIFSDGLASGGKNQNAGLVLGPWRTGAKGIRIDKDGNVGIGVAQPQAALDVVGNAHVSLQLSVPKVIGEQNANTQFQLCANTSSNDGGCINLWGNGSTLRPGHISLTAGNGNGTNKGEIRFMQNTGTGYDQHMVIASDGNVGIGMDEPDASLHVKGTIKLADMSGTNQFEVNEAGVVHCREVEVNMIPIPDYVFEPTYELMSLSDLRTYINENHHLPEVKSATEYEAEGHIDLGELSVKMLQKIEELTLYTLELEEKIQKLEEQTDSSQK